MNNTTVEHLRDLAQRCAARSENYAGTENWRQREAWYDARVQLRAAALALDLAISSERLED